MDQIECRVAKVRGSIYYCYKKLDGKKLLTIISPKEWNSNCPFEYIGAYRLNFDNTWIPCEQENDGHIVDLEGSLRKIKDIF